MQRAFNLSKHVYYDPTIFLTREDGHIRRDGKVVPNPIDGETPSDLDLLRAMGLHVPGVDPETNIRMSLPSSQCANTNSPPTRIAGQKCTIEITYSASTEEKAKRPVEIAVRKWTDEFDSAVTIRICFGWGGVEEAALGEKTLGTTNTPFFTHGKDHSNLRDDAVYNPALASSLQGEDMIPEGQFHVHMLLNRMIPWHYDETTEAPSKKYDLATTVLHELTHGLFFSGTIEVPQDERSASYMHKVPGRFDSFMRVEGDIGVVRSCAEPDRLFNAVTSPYLRFFDEENTANFALFAPYPFASGSSIYHFNNTKSLLRECNELGIPDLSCSDLMTHELVYAYTQRSLGETTLRVYRAMRSNAAGPPSGRKCDVADNSGRNGLAFGTNDPFTLPLWAIITVAGLGGLGAILVFGVIISSVTRGKN